MQNIALCFHRANRAKAAAAALPAPAIRIVGRSAANPPFAVIEVKDGPEELAWEKSGVEKLAAWLVGWRTSAGKPFQMYSEHIVCTGLGAGQSGFQVIPKRKEGDITDQEDLCLSPLLCSSKIR